MLRRDEEFPYLILFGSNVKRSVSIFSRGVRRGAFIQKKESHILMVVVASNVKRSHAILLKKKE